MYDESVFRVHRADGTLIMEAVPQLAIDACAEVSLKQRNTQLDLVIDEATAFPNWDGEPMDRAMAIDGMFGASGDFRECCTATGQSLRGNADLERVMQ